MFRKSGYRFSDENMRQCKRSMFRKSGYRFSDENMGQCKRSMFRKSGYRFSDENMRQDKRSMFRNSGYPHPFPPPLAGEGRERVRQPKRSRAYPVRFERDKL